ncbi:MAG: hypothetical protein K2M50_07810 [Treponemataceae bacterium]|nr:hypothetical protein [Treponema sp.]MDE6245545.1 hypothetical protein [Treponemataceae bacterium]
MNSDKTTIVKTKKESSEKIVFVCISKSYARLSEGIILKGRDNLYECIRKYWKIKPCKANKADYIAGVFHGEIQGIYKNFPDWKLVKDIKEFQDDEEVKEHPSFLERYALAHKEEAAECFIQKKYIGKSFRLYGSVGYNFDI